ncbi:MAG TPA: amidohydrolase family protein [bacterium]|nr:amidohydrolase family protein [bacterium]
MNKIYTVKKILIALLILLFVFSCSKKEESKQVDESLKSLKSKSSKSEVKQGDAGDNEEGEEIVTEKVDIPKTNVEYKELPDNPGDKESDFTGNYVDGPTFLKLKNSVTAELVKTIKPADNKPRVEKKLTKPIALRGTIVTPQKVIEDGVIIIEYRTQKMKGKLGTRLIGEIKRVANYSKNLVPAKVPLIDLSGNYIYPGFIDMHNHVHYNAFDLWKPTYDIYPNRNVWPRDPRYADWKKINNYFSRKQKDLLIEVTKYGEIRNLIGGGTTMQGFMGDFQGSYGLCRNVENGGNLLGVNTIRQTVMPVSMWWVGSSAEDKRDKVISGFDKNVKRYIIHFCEGIDDDIREEYLKMKEFNLLREEFVGIHSTGVRGDDWNDIAKAGMKVVWSPLSNLMLYNKTTDIKGALDRGVPFQHISFAPDWAPSGSPSMLFEAKVVAEYNHKKLKGLLSPKQIVLMMTENPAIISGYDEFIGTITEGKRADITVLKKRSDDPYKSVLLNEA